MNIDHGSDVAKKFVTNVGLITSSGPHGNNIMAAEWTYHVSYEPGLVVISLRPSRATYDNIMKTKEFGVSICASDQNVLSSIAGGSSGKDINKIKVAKDLGFNFYNAKKIKVLMVKDAAANIECKLVDKIKTGDHVLFVGEAVEISATDKQPIIYSAGKYWKFGDQVHKPHQEFLDNINKLVEKHKK